MFCGVSDFGLFGSLLIEFYYVGQSFGVLFMGDFGGFGLRRETEKRCQGGRTRITIALRINIINENKSLRIK
jgi:hypothetical protein